METTPQAPFMKQTETTLQNPAENPSETTSQNAAQTQTETSSQDPTTQIGTTHGERGGRKGRRAPAAYFDAGFDVRVHETMLKDNAWIESYSCAINYHQSLIQDKVVMDVGCGTGILSILCAKAGARLVYAVEASGIAELAKQVVEANHLADKVIVKHGKVEDIQIDEEVDVIISSWMGYMLLFEGMLENVIFAREQWLKKGGLILPSHATLYMAPITHPERYRDTISFWHNVHGINMSPMMQIAKQRAFTNPCVEKISNENVLTFPFMVKRFNCYTVHNKDLQSFTTFNIQSNKQAPLHGFAFWFEVEFDGTLAHSNDPTQPSTSMSSDHCPVVVSPSQKLIDLNEAPSALILSTAPVDDPTHWSQTIIYIDDPKELEKDQCIEGSLEIKQSTDCLHDFNIHLEYILGGFSHFKHCSDRRESLC